MQPSNHYEAMERDELVRLAGEQALLKQELQRLNAEQHRDLNALRNLPNDIGRAKDWHARGVELLNRLHEREREIADGYQRAANYSKLTGIS